MFECSRDAICDYIVAASTIPASRDVRASLHIKNTISKKEQRHLKEHALRGDDIVDSVVRLYAMSLYLHGNGGDECPITTNDALAKEVGGDRVDMVQAVNGGPE